MEVSWWGLSYRDSTSHKNWTCKHGSKVRSNPFTRSSRHSRMLTTLTRSRGGTHFSGPNHYTVDQKDPDLCWTKRTKEEKQHPDCCPLWEQKPGSGWMGKQWACPSREKFQVQTFNRMKEEESFRRVQQDKLKIVPLSGTAVVASCCRADGSGSGRLQSPPAAGYCWTP